MKLNVAAALLCVAALTAGVVAVNGPPQYCCPKTTSTKVPIDKIAGYRVQTAGLCPVDAIIFHTKAGIRICSNPDDGWTKKAMKKVDNDGKKKTTTKTPQTEFTKITTKTPETESTNTTTKTPETESTSTTFEVTKATRKAPKMPKLAWTLRKRRQKHKKGLRKAQRNLRK